MENKVVLITGASKGIGAQIAKTFALNGYKIIINYNNSREQAEKLANEICRNGGLALAVKADITDEQQVKDLVDFSLKNFGHIDCLINNAGICSYNLLIDESIENISSMLNTNLLGTILCTKYVALNMLKNNYGKIINISSIWGEKGAVTESIYSATKGAVNTFTRSMAKELAYNNITVNAIAPGVVDTEMIKKFSAKEKEALNKEIPLGRFASLQEIADLALFLASEKANYITGQILTIDGGFTL